MGLGCPLIYRLCTDSRRGLVSTSSFSRIFESTVSMVDIQVSMVEAVIRSSMSANEEEAGGEDGEPAGGATVDLGRGQLLP